MTHLHVLCEDRIAGIVRSREARRETYRDGGSGRHVARVVQAAPVRSVTRNGISLTCNIRPVIVTLCSWSSKGYVGAGGGGRKCAFTSTN